MICHYCRKPLVQALALPIEVAWQTVFMHRACFSEYADVIEKIERDVSVIEQQLLQLTGGSSNE